MKLSGDNSEYAQKASMVHYVSNYCHTIKPIDIDVTESRDEYKYSTNFFFFFASFLGCYVNA